MSDPMSFEDAALDSEFTDSQRATPTGSPGDRRAAGGRDFFEGEAGSGVLFSPLATADTSMETNMVSTAGEDSSDGDKTGDDEAARAQRREDRKLRQRRHERKHGKTRKRKKSVTRPKKPVPVELELPRDSLGRFHKSDAEGGADTSGEFSSSNIEQSQQSQAPRPGRPRGRSSTKENDVAQKDKSPARRSKKRGPSPSVSVLVNSDDQKDGKPRRRRRVTTTLQAKKEAADAKSNSKGGGKHKIVMVEDEELATGQSTPKSSQTTSLSVSPAVSSPRLTLSLKNTKSRKKREEEELEKQKHIQKQQQSKKKITINTKPKAKGKSKKDNSPVEEEVGVRRKSTRASAVATRKRISHMVDSELNSSDMSMTSSSDEDEEEDDDEDEAPEKVENGNEEEDNDEVLSRESMSDDDGENNQSSESAQTTPAATPVGKRGGRPKSTPTASIGASANKKTAKPEPEAESTDDKPVKKRRRRRTAVPPVEEVAATDSEVVSQQEKPEENGKVHKGHKMSHTLDFDTHSVASSTISDATLMNGVKLDRSASNETLNSDVTDIKKRRIHRRKKEDKPLSAANKNLAYTEYISDKIRDLNNDPTWLPIPVALKAYLVDDWEKVTAEDKYVALPRKIPVKKVMELYEKWAVYPENIELFDIIVESLVAPDTVLAKMRKFKEENKKDEQDPSSKSVFDSTVKKLTRKDDVNLQDVINGKREVVFDEKEVLPYFIEGLKELFTIALPNCLLYKAERLHYARAKHRLPTKEIIDIYGAEHLLRFFASLTDVLKNINIEKGQAKILKTYSLHFLQFLVENIDTLLLEDYQEMTLSYINEANR